MTFTKDWARSKDALLKLFRHCGSRRTALSSNPLGKKSNEVPATHYPLRTLRKKFTLWTLVAKPRPRAGLSPSIAAAREIQGSFEVRLRSRPPGIDREGLRN